MSAELVLTFRGLRVRVGLHCPTPQDIQDHLKANHEPPRGELGGSKWGGLAMGGVAVGMDSGPFARPSKMPSTKSLVASGGTFLSAAKTVGDVGAGGMITISPTCFERLRSSAPLAEAREWGLFRAWSKGGAKKRAQVRCWPIP